MFGSFGRHLSSTKFTKRKTTKQLESFEHTHLGVYFVGVVTVVCIFIDSCQGVLENYHVSKKWFYLFGILCFFAYWYIQPLIRRGIGSASSGYLNYYSIYIFWLCSAVFYHLPKLEDMGMDLKADISVMIFVFTVTVLMISLMHGLHRWAVSCGYISPFLISPAAEASELRAAIMINSMSLAIACSTYFSFCGNAVAEEMNPSSSWMKKSVCHGWLEPVEADKYPTFKSWVLYGERGSFEANKTGIDSEVKSNSVLLGTDDVISPVLMVWITLLSMYFVNCVADHLAVREIEVKNISQVRRRLSDSITVTSSYHKTDAPVLIGRSNSLDAKHFPPLDCPLSPSSRRGRLDQFDPIDLVFDPFEEDSETRPDFLPMVPWYCGTSADLIKMSFDLTVSLKLFLGRFDMRMMEAATSNVWSQGPHDGDGFTFLKFRNQDELVFDFFADTGDGGNSTYCIARALASPSLRVNNHFCEKLDSSLFLPRAELLLLGGDLAYPSPSSESYAQRLFSPFHDAMPGPTEHPGPMMMQKSKDWRPGKHPWTDWTPWILDLERRLPPPPQCFAIPGNHDWHDGLEVFMQSILHRGWLGGWELPQEKSYFAIALPQNWWIFGADLALVWDIDAYQYKYFVQVIERHLDSDSQVIIMTHEPIWMEDWITCSPDSTAPNLKELIREHLRGRARLCLAGDLHFYMRHSVTKLDPDEEQKLLDPDHLIIQGTGGAFLHPTHVFCGAKLDAKSSDVSCKAEYSCQSVYPSATKSLELAKDSFSRFRSMNTRFDIVGALWYFLLVWSVFPRCKSVQFILEAQNSKQIIHRFLLCFCQSFEDIFSRSYVSLVALGVLFLATFLFAMKGSVGCAKLSLASCWEEKLQSCEQWYLGFPDFLIPAASRGFKARTGGYFMCIVFAIVHTLAHLTIAILLMLVLETGIYTCIKYKIVGSSGYHSLYLWFDEFFSEHFPDPMGVGEFIQKYSFGLYPSVLKYFMTVFDVPELIAVGRIQICEAQGTIVNLTRLQTIGYYGGMLAYYWLLAAPAMGLVFGLYLYISCCYFHVHYDEAFSALRIQHHKGFCRMKICKNGDLEVFTVAVDRVPEKWIEDPSWRKPSGGYSNKVRILSFS
eukprot:g6591.t1